MVSPEIKFALLAGLAAIIPRKQKINEAGAFID
jgi:hypothetical protein